MNTQHKICKNNNRIRRLARQVREINELLPAARMAVEKGETQPQMVEDMLTRLHSVENALLARQGVVA